MRHVHYANVHVTIELLTPPQNFRQAQRPGYDAHEPIPPYFHRRGAPWQEHLPGPPHRPRLVAPPVLLRIAGPPMPPMPVQRNRRPRDILRARGIDLNNVIYDGRLRRRN